MKTPLRVLVATIGLAGTAALLPSLAIGAAPAAGAAPAHLSAPTSIDYLESSLVNGQSTYITGTTQSVSGQAANSLELVATGHQAFSVTLTLPPADAITAGGTIYSLQIGVNVSVTTPTGPCNSNTGLAGVEVDQLVRDGSGNVLTAGMQYFCVDGAGNDYQGAMSFQLRPSTPGQGYYLYEQDGLISPFGNDNYLVYLGDLSAANLNRPIIAMATTPSGAGYWMVGADGGIFSFGDAGFFGSTGSFHLNSPIVGMAATADGKGYWLVAADGGIFSFGDAKFHGSMGGKPLNKPIVGMAANPVGSGYWLVATDGGIFSFGDAPFFGSTGHIRLNMPVVGMEPTSDGRGYWFVATDGGIFTYGDARFHGSTGNLSLNSPITGMLATPNDAGYWLVANDGGIFSFNAPFYGSLGNVGVDDVAGMVI
jgi:hypothetical protein